jgi:hypothetical protein
MFPESPSHLGGPAVRDLLRTYPHSPHGRGCGVGRCLWGGMGLGVGVGRIVAVGVAVGVGGGVEVGVAVAVAVAVGVGGGGEGVTVGVASVWAGA